MSAGTITLTNNSATVTGSGTAFTTDLKVGDFVTATVGGTLYSLIVSAIASNTSLTLNLAYTGPTTGSLAWAAVPSQVLAAITAQIVVESTKALRGLNFDKANWQQIFTGTGNVTVTMPDMTTWTGPAWNGITTQLNNITTQLNNKAAKGANSDITSLTGLTTALSVAQGGTGGKTAGEARSALGLGTAATANITTSTLDNTTGSVLKVADFGLGATSLTQEDRFDSNPFNSFIRVATGSGNGLPTNGAGFGVRMSLGTTDKAVEIYDASVVLPRKYIRKMSNSAYGNWYEFWTTANTTTDTNNFIKKASPIARLSDDVSKMQADYDGSDGFRIDGHVSVNDEATGVTAKKLSTGIYVVSGSAGMAKEGWTIEIPQDINGNRLCFVELATDKDGVITVSVFKRRFDVDSAMIVAGEPMDIPAGRWIDLRLQMPEDSAWNKRMLDTTTTEKITETKADASTQTE